MENNKLRNIVKSILKENFDDDDFDLGNYSGGFDSSEFEGDAMKAAMKDINDSGDKFVPLGKSKFEKGLNKDKFKKDLERQNLNLPNDNDEVNRISKTLAKKKAHEKIFGAGSLNESHKIDGNDPLFLLLKEKGLNPTAMPWGTIEVDINNLHGDETLSFHKVQLNKDNIYTADLIWDSPLDGGGRDVEKNIFFGDLDKTINFALSKKQKAEKELESVPKVNFAPNEPEQIGPKIVGKIDLPKDNKKRFKEGENSGLDRPTDAEGNSLSLKMRVEDIDTKAVGRILRFGIDDNGKQTVHVEWINNFGGQIPKTITYPEKVLARDQAKIVKEEDLEESNIRSHANGRGQNIKPSNYTQNLKRVGIKESKNLNEEAKDYISDELKQFFISESFDIKKSGHYSYKLKIPKQADETLKDIENFIKESTKASQLYTLLEKGTNKWIIEVKGNK